MTVSEANQLSREDMRKYGGQYVAAMDGKVVASGKNLYKKVRELEEKHSGCKIVVNYVPKEDLLIL